MNSITLLSMVAICLVVVAQAAPVTDSPAGQESTSTPAPTTTPTPPAQPTTSPAQAAVETAAPITNQTSHDTGDHVKTSFTCYGRTGGYYADAELACKVYHYCMAGDINGELVYQRITYLCLNETLFDQKVTECVEPAKMSAPCHQEAAGHQSNGTQTTSTTSTTTPAA